MILVETNRSQRRANFETVSAYPIASRISDKVSIII